MATSPMIGWPNGTRRKIIRLGSKSKGTSNPLVWDLPRTGILGSIILDIDGSISGSLSAESALGFAAVISRIRVIANAGINLIDISGEGYYNLLKNFLETGWDVVSQGQGRTAITATTFNLPIVLPVAINSRDEAGLMLLQDEDIQLRLEVEFRADASVATGATVAATCEPFLELFTVPLDPKNRPSFVYAQQITEETAVVSGAGDQTYNWPRGNIYMQTIHGLGIGASGSAADGFSNLQVKVNQADYLADVGLDYLDAEFDRYHGSARPLGVAPVDFMSVSGLGNYGSSRDFFDSQRVTDLASVVRATGAGTLYTLRRMLVPLG